jgi:hypothetical protein
MSQSNLNFCVSESPKCRVDVPANQLSIKLLGRLLDMKLLRWLYTLQILRILR